MEPLLAPLVWLLSIMLWAIALVIAIAFVYSIPLILLWVGWAFFRKQLIKAGIKKEWVKKVKDRYFIILVRYFKFWFFDLPTFLYRLGRGAVRKMRPWVQRNYPVWLTWVKNVTGWIFRAAGHILKFFFVDAPRFSYRAACSARRKIGNWLQTKLSLWYTRLHQLKII